MFLSNRLKFAAIFITVCTSACGWYDTTNEPKLQVQTQRSPELPFAASEPDEFQADFFVIANGVESKRFYARKLTKWKLVLFDNDVAVSEIIHSDINLLIDHRRHVFAEVTDNVTGFEPDFIQEMTIRALREREYTNYEDLGSTSGIRRFRAIVRDRDSSPSIIHYDENLKMITKQEFFQNNEVSNGEPIFVYEMRNAVFDVSDTVFIAPENYRKVSKAAFYTAFTQKDN